MSTPQNDSFQFRAPKPADSRYLKNEIIPWVSVAEVNAAIPSAYRHQGLTVLIGTREYWYNGGTTDGNLVPKSESDNSATLILTADGYYEFPTRVVVIALVVTTDTLINFKAGSAVGLEDFVPTVQLSAGSVVLGVLLLRNAGQRIYFGGISGSNTTIVIKTI